MICLECREEITGRADKKFCSDQCRTHYHNQLLISENKKMRNVNNVLRRNRKILCEFLGEQDLLRIPRERLLLRGFDFTFHTQQLKPAKGNTWTIIYDLACALEKEQVIIARKEHIEALI